MTLEVLVGVVGIIVAAMTFIGGMLAFIALDKPNVEGGPARQSDPAVSPSTRVH